MELSSHGCGGPVGETVAEALARLTPPPEAPRSVASALAEPPAKQPEDLLAERVLRWWKPVAGVGAALLMMFTVVSVRSLSGGTAEPRDLPSDAAYLAEIGREIESRCVTWQNQLHEAESLLAAANLEPMRISLRASDPFAGARKRPRLYVEGALKTAGSPSPLRLPPRGGLTVRKFHDRNARGTVTRVIEAGW